MSSLSTGTTATTADSSTSSIATIATSTSSNISSSASTLTAKPTAGLKTGPIVGIAVSSVIGGIAVIALLVLVSRRYRHSTPPPPSTYESKDYYAFQQSPCPPPLNELPTASLPEFPTRSKMSELSA
ncbi:hypothetical protein B0O99DRAFT_254648, partial [Bisporella sp. PMI_857]